jgi:hypothetical protein
VLVPVIGTVANRAAQELAYSLAARAGAEVVILHVEPEPRVQWSAYGSARTQRRDDIAAGTRGGTGFGPAA